MQPITHLNPLVRERRDDRKIIVWDIEAAPVWDSAVAPITQKQRELGEYEPLNTRFLGAGVYDGLVYKHVNSVDDLCKIFFSDYCRNSIIYAHNGSRYDCAFILPYIIQSGMRMQATYVGSKLWLFFEDRTIADSMAILPHSLERIGEKLNCAYVKQEIDYRHIEQYDWQSYLKNDCFLLYEAIMIFRRMMEDLGGQVKLTLASTAMHLFRRHYQRQTLYTNRSTHEIERKALYGGRTELFKKKACDVFYYDINSSYSLSALEPLPYAFHSEAKHAGEVEDSDIVLADVFVPPEYIPSLPYRGERLIFPVGRWEGYYVGRELKYADVEYKVLRQWKYRCSDFLADYSKDLFRQKEGNPAAKLLLNTLYGRFALMEEREQIIFRPTPEEFLGRALVPINEYESIYKFKERIPTFTFPAVFANITAQARINLLKGLREANDNICYCDTDSIISTKELNLDIGKGLGQWGFVGKYKEFQGIAPKTYRLDDNLKAKGFRLPEGMSAKEFLKDKKMKQHRMVSIKQQLKTGEKQGLTGHKRTVRISDEKRTWEGNASFPLTMES